MKDEKRTEQRLMEKLRLEQLREKQRLNLKSVHRELRKNYFSKRSAEEKKYRQDKKDKQEG
eukprot:snap_masked-scaffold_7-processed-gene-6.2-mRNA-1 protein AED:1.00 eAED:1.00 QI:0/-1/0/0/-1/1/1/0/60